MTRLEDLLNIDKGRLARAADIDVELSSSTLVLTEASNKIVRWFRKLFKMPKIARFVHVFTCTNRTNGNVNKVVLEVPPVANINELLHSKVRLYCSCGDFMFRSAYYLNKTGNLFLNSTTTARLGEAISTQPTKVSTVKSCKHIAAVAKWLRAKTNFIQLKLN